MVSQEYCSPLLAFFTNRRLKNGKVCPKECLEWVNSRRNGPMNAAAIKVVMYQEPYLKDVVAALNQQQATLLDLNFAMPGCRSLLLGLIIEALKLKPTGLCSNLDFVALPHLKALFWDGSTSVASRKMLAAFPNLAVIAYKDCRFTHKVQLGNGIRIIICCALKCRCNLARMKGWQKTYEVKCGPHVLGGLACIFFKTRDDFLCFGDYSGVSRMRYTQNV